MKEAKKPSSNRFYSMIYMKENNHENKTIKEEDPENDEEDPKKREDEENPHTKEERQDSNGDSIILSEDEVSAPRFERKKRKSGFEAGEEGKVGSFSNSIIMNGQENLASIMEEKNENTVQSKKKRRIGRITRMGTTINQPANKETELLLGKWGDLGFVSKSFERIRRSRESFNEKPEWLGGFDETSFAKKLRVSLHTSNLASCPSDKKGERKEMQNNPKSEVFSVQDYLGDRESVVSGSQFYDSSVEGDSDSPSYEVSERNIIEAEIGKETFYGELILEENTSQEQLSMKPMQKKEQAKFSLLANKIKLLSFLTTQYNLIITYSEMFLTSRTDPIISTSSILNINLLTSAPICSHQHQSPHN